MISAAADILDVISQNPKKINVEKFKLALKQFPHMIDYKFYLPNEYLSLPFIVKYRLDIDEEKRRELLDVILNVGSKIGDFLFYAAARCDLYFIERSLKNTTSSLLINTKVGNTPLAFLLKFGNIYSKNYVECVKLLVCEENVNQLDYYAQTPITIALKEYLKLPEDGQKIMDSVIEILIKHGARRTRVYEETLKEFEESYYKLNFPNEVAKLNPNQKLFDYLIRNEQSKFKHLYKETENNINICNINDGECTLLQLAVICDNKSIVHTLLNKNTDKNATTTRNPNTSLLLAAILDRKDIFHMLIETVEITTPIFNCFVKYRCMHLLTEYFFQVLKSPNLDVNLKSFLGNTPLHFAIIFGNISSIHSLLRRGASLTTPNDAGLTCIEFISKKDLKSYYDSCIIFDKYSEILSEKDSKVTLDFTNVVQEQTSEVELIKKFGSSDNTISMLQHPLIDIFVNVKWHLCKTYFNIFALFKLLNCYLIFLILLKDGSSVYGLLIFESIFFAIWTLWSVHLFKTRWLDFIIYFLLTSLFFFDVILISIKRFHGSQVPTIIMRQINCVIYVLLATSVLITLGYNLKFSKWAVMLQRVYKTYFINLLYLFIPLSAFAIGITHLLHADDEDYNIFHSLFIIAQTLSGSVVPGGLQNSEQNFFVYLIFVGFVIISLGTMNFLVGLAVNDIQQLDRNWESISYNNVLIFIQFVERLYTKFPKLCYFLRLPSPFIKTKSRGLKLEIYIHLTEQCRHRKALRDFKLSDISKLKIKTIYENRLTKTVDDKLQAGLEIIEKNTSQALYKIYKELKDMHDSINSIKHQINFKRSASIITNSTQEGSK